MSVDYLTCNCCEENFPDCGYYVSCESCGTHWCSDECAEEDGYISEHCKKFPILSDRDEMEDYREKNCDYEDCTDCPYYKPDSCKYCRNEDYSDNVLLEKALELLNMSREDLIKIVNNDEKN